MSNMGADIKDMYSLLGVRVHKHRNTPYTDTRQTHSKQQLLTDTQVAI